jgi:hypothetical protein
MHQFLLALLGEARNPFNLTTPPLKHIGHSHVSIVEDGKLCQGIAKTGHTQQQAARSLNNAVGKVRRKFVDKCLESDAELTEVLNIGPLQKYTIQLHPIEGAREEIAVFRDGTTSLSGAVEEQLA